MLKQMGARIKEKRKEAHLSQAKLAELTGYSDKTAISKIELGKIDLPQSKLMLIANVLNTTPARIKKPLVPINKGKSETNGPRK